MSTNYEKTIRENLEKLYDHLPENLEESLPAIRQGETFTFTAFGEECTIEPERISLDFSLLLYPLPKIALCYIFYLPDEDFPASVTCLFSANAHSFMPLDGLADVAECTSKEIMRILERRG